MSADTRKYTVDDDIRTGALTSRHGVLHPSTLALTSETASWTQEQDPQMYIQAPPRRIKVG